MLSRKVSRKWPSTDEGVEMVSRYKTNFKDQKLDRSTKCRGGIEETEEISIDPHGVETGVEKEASDTFNGISIDPSGVEDVSRRQKLSRSIHQVSRMCRDCDKKKA